jgi:hypothetical protein
MRVASTALAGGYTDNFQGQPGMPGATPEQQSHGVGDTYWSVGPPGGGVSATYGFRIS